MTGSSRDEEPYARAALIARDPEIESLVNQGMIGDRFVVWVRRIATFFGATFFAWIVFHVAR